MPTSLVICSPNNPTGALLPTQGSDTNSATNAKGWSLLDEAYHEFSGQSVADLVAATSEPDRAADVFQSHVDGRPAIRLPDGASGNRQGNPQRRNFPTM